MSIQNSDLEACQRANWMIIICNLKRIQAHIEILGINRNKVWINTINDERTRQKKTISLHSYTLSLMWFDQTSKSLVHNYIKFYGFHSSEFGRSKLILRGVHLRLVCAFFSVCENKYYTENTRENTGISFGVIYFDTLHIKCTKILCK